MAKRGPKKGEGGAPEKISPDVIKRICDAIRLGSYVETAAVYAGISRKTFYNWLKLGQDEKSEQAYKDFYQEVEKALAQAQLRDIQIIDRAAQQGQWQAAAWKLERKYPKEWGRKETVKNIDGEDDLPQENLHKALVDLIKDNE